MKRPVTSFPLCGLRNSNISARKFSTHAQCHQAPRGRITFVVSRVSWRLTGHPLHSPDEWPYADIPAHLCSLPILLGTEGFCNFVYFVCWIVRKRRLEGGMHHCIRIQYNKVWSLRDRGNISTPARSSTSLQRKGLIEISGSPALISTTRLLHCIT